MGMKILAHIPQESDGTSFYRGMGPLSRLGVEIVRAPNRFFDWNDIIDCDVCFFQRPATQVEVLQIEFCKKMNKPVWVDWDDDGFNIGEDNPAAEFYQRDVVHATLRHIAKIADIVTVSTYPLRDVVLKQTPEAKVTVVPNAVDDKLFSVERYEGPRTKRILLRGAGSHDLDWKTYKDGIIQITQLYPDYRLAVMGFHPDWLREIPANQIEYYQFSDIPTYFKTLMSLRPKLTIVPLQQNQFNRSKSAIAMFEGVIAGCPAIASNLPEFHGYGACVVEGNGDLIVKTKELLENQDEWNDYYNNQLDCLPVLSEVNELRKDVIETLIKSPRKKYTPEIPIFKTATDQEFHDHNLSHGNSQDNPEFKKSHFKAAEYLIGKVKPKTAVEYGCGTGATLLGLLQGGVMARGLEINPLSVEYFKDHHPMYENQIYLFDFTKEPIEGDVPCDLGLSIEVFEHIDMPERWWEDFIENLSKQYRHFYFSSTPYKTTDEFDHYWSHVNLRRTTDWIRLFQLNGWSFVENPRILTSWDCLFRSNNIK